MDDYRPIDEKVIRCPHCLKVSNKHTNLLYKSHFNICPSCGESFEIEVINNPTYITYKIPED